MDPQLARIFGELGFTFEALRHIQSLPLQEATRQLEALKLQARKRFKQLAFQYHPDRNPGDAEALALFKLLTPALEALQKTVVGPRRPQPPAQPETAPVAQQGGFSVGMNTPRGPARRVRFEYFPRAHPFGGSVTAVTDANGVTRGRYDATKVVVMRYR